MHKLPLDVGCIKEERYNAEGNHNMMKIARLLAEVDNDMHDEDCWQIPKWAIERFGKRTFMFKQQCTNNRLNGLYEIREASVLKVKADEPIGIDNGII